MTYEKFLAHNKLDIRDGLTMLMNAGYDGVKYTQDFLASAANVTPSQISHLLRPEDVSTPTLATLTKILMVFNMTMLEFFVFVDQNKFRPK